MFARDRSRAPALGREESRRISARIRAVEASTGVDIVVALVGRSALYHGLRWRAFAFGTVLAAVAVVLADSLYPDWLQHDTVLLAVLGVMAGGFGFLFLASFSAGFERLFLQHSRAHAALNQRARVLFLERELFATPSRNAVMLVAGAFEHVFAVLGDTGYHGRIADAEWQAVVDAATPAMARGDWAAAFEAALGALQSLLTSRGFAGDAADLLDDTPIELDGEP